MRFRNFVPFGLCVLPFVVALLWSVNVFGADDHFSLPGGAWATATFTTNPTAVACDVIDVGDGSSGTQVGDSIAASVMQIDSNDSAEWKCLLSGVSGWPTDCTEKHYYVEFNPDATDCSAPGSPATCQRRYVRTGGAACRAALAAKTYSSPINVHTTVVVVGQGITQTVLDFYNRRGVLPLKWQKYPGDASLSFGTPDTTHWLIYFYQETLSAPRVLCVVPTTSDPDISLPSSAHCS